MKDNISEEELQRAKNQLHGEWIREGQTMYNRMVNIGKSELLFGRQIPIEETLRYIDKVTHDDIDRVASQLFKDNEYCTIILGPVEDM